MSSKQKTLPPGYVPYQLVPPRWSFSLSNANFSGAIVSLSTNGVSIPVTLEPMKNGYGENTLVWYPSSLNPNLPYSWPRPSSDTTYNVTISNVVFGGAPHTYNYSVKIFDPAVPGLDTVLPMVSGPDWPAVFGTNAYTFSIVPIATGYQWRQARRDMFTAVEGAENGLTNFMSDVSPGYCIVTNNPVASGAAAFHLAHPEPGDDQTLTFTRILLPGTNSVMQFKSRLGWATPDQVANVQVSVDEGSSWINVYSQAGTSSSGETSYNTRSISLTNFTDHPLLIRFRYVVPAGGSYYSDTYSGVGWYIDDISFSHTEELTSCAISNVTSDTSSFNFIPTLNSNYMLQVRAQVFSNEYYLEWGPVKYVVASSVFITDGSLVSGTNEMKTALVSAPQEIRVNFIASNYPSYTFLLYKSSKPDGPWTDTGVTHKTNEYDKTYYFISSIGDDDRSFFRVKAQKR
jgi:hypothetical protein